MDEPGKSGVEIEYEIHPADVEGYPVTETRRVTVPVTVYRHDLREIFGAISDVLEDLLMRLGDAPEWVPPTDESVDPYEGMGQG